MRTAVEHLVPLAYRRHAQHGLGAVVEVGSTSTRRGHTARTRQQARKHMLRAHTRPHRREKACARQHAHYMYMRPLYEPIFRDHEIGGRSPWPRRARPPPDATVYPRGSRRMLACADRGLCVRGEAYTCVREAWQGPINVTSNMRLGILGVPRHTEANDGARRRVGSARAQSAHLHASHGRRSTAAPQKSRAIQPERCVHEHEECQCEMRAARQGDGGRRRAAARSNRMRVVYAPARLRCPRSVARRRATVATTTGDGSGGGEDGGRHARARARGRVIVKRVLRVIVRSCLMTTRATASSSATRALRAVRRTPRPTRHSWAWGESRAKKLHFLCPDLPPVAPP